MPEFSFKGRDHHQQLITGKKFAETESGVAAQLTKEGITPIEITPFHEPPDPFATLRKKLNLMRVKTTDLMMFCRQMHTLQKAGIPIVSAVMRCAETSHNQYLSATLLKMIDRLNAGQDLATACENFPDIFPTLLVNLIRVGEYSGKLDEAFLHAAKYLELEGNTRQQVKTALRYPTFVITIIVVAILVINTLVIPAFAQLFSQYRAQFPWPTRMLIGFSEFLTGYWYLLLIAAVIIWFLTRFYLHTESGRMNWHRILLKIPIVGPILRKIYLTRFSRSFAVVTQAGLPLNEGLRLVAVSMGNVYIAEQIDKMNENIGRGESLSQAAIRTHLFSPLTIQMLATGEETGNLDAMCNEVASFYESEVEYELKRLNTTIEPLLIICIGGMVLILALAVFLPMWDIVNIARKYG